MLHFIGSCPRREILGINQRNLHYLFLVNQRQKYPSVDNKLITKKILACYGIPTPTLYTVFHRHFELNELGERIDSLSSFVIKPAKGACGNGVIILHREKEGRWHDENENVWNLADIKQHVSSIISGIFSLAGQQDSAMVEERIFPPDFLKRISARGCPDIRIIVYREVPTMAMLRLPTLHSMGRSNLHCGAVGVGIEIETGKTTKGVYRNRIISLHPDTGMAIAEIRIPQWDRILEMAVRSSSAVGLGYVGVDIVLDEKRSALVMELNARPGLSIQIVNRRGLIPYLKKIDTQLEKKEV